MKRQNLNYLRRSLRVRLNKWLNREFVEDNKHPVIEISGACNLNCVFCAYREKKDAKVVMSEPQFSEIVDQLTDLGYRHFGLTPQTGDVFVDKRFNQKIDILEQNDKVDGYEFITNLISATPDILEHLMTAKKLKRMYISLYGHDAESFTKITARSPHQFKRLITNLNILTEHAHKFSGDLGSFIMTERSLSWSPTTQQTQDEPELLTAVRQLAEAAPSFEWTGNHTDFDSWGGIVSQNHLDELDMDFQLVGPSVPMFGPCEMLFGGQIVLADGQVNACACRAVNKSLIIGNTKTTPLKDILSPTNPAFQEILELHTSGNYPSACRDCKVFTSIYRRPNGRATITVDDYLQKQTDRCS